MPKPWIEKLSLLQDKVPARPIEEVLRTIGKAYKMAEEEVEEAVVEANALESDWLTEENADESTSSWFWYSDEEESAASALDKKKANEKPRG